MFYVIFYRVQKWTYLSNEEHFAIPYWCRDTSAYLRLFREMVWMIETLKPLNTDVYFRYIILLNAEFWISFIFDFKLWESELKKKNNLIVFLFCQNNYPKLHTRRQFGSGVFVEMIVTSPMPILLPWNTSDQPYYLVKVPLVSHKPVFRIQHFGN